MKTQKYFINQAIVRTILTGVFYLIMPIPAKWYSNLIGNGYVGYIVFGGGILILGSIIMLIRSWNLALDSDARSNYNKNN